MRKHDFQLIVKISIAITTIIVLVILKLSHEQQSLKVFLRAVSSSVSFTLVFWLFFITYGWRWPVLKYLFYRPDVNGTWGGILNSDWKDATGNPCPSIVFYVVIRQTFLNLHITTFTNNFIGQSYSETFSLNKEKGLKCLAYLYRKVPSPQDDDVLQEGATELRLIESQQMILEGIYWSNRKTNGTIKVTKVSAKHADSFEQAKKIRANG